MPERRRAERIKEKVIAVAVAEEKESKMVSAIKEELDSMIPRKKHDGFIYCQGYIQSLLEFNIINKKEYNSLSIYLRTLYRRREDDKEKESNK